MFAGLCLAGVSKVSSPVAMTMPQASRSVKIELHHERSRKVLEGLAALKKAKATYALLPRAGC